MAGEATDTQGVDIEINSITVSPEAQTQMRMLDRFVAEQKVDTEIFGWGLTTVESGQEIVTDFIVPDPEKIFIMDTRSISQVQKKFMNLLADASSLEFRVNSDSVELIPDGDMGNENGLMFPTVDGKIQWEMAKDNVSKLVGFELPDNTVQLQEEVKKRQDGKAIQNPNSIQLKSDWELVLSGASAIVTSDFIKRVVEIAEKKNAKLNFTMHHHPNQAGALLNGKSLKDRQDYYRRHLGFSPADLRSMAERDINFFEIRTLGTVDDPTSNTETTGRIYSVREILEDSNRLGELLVELQSPQNEHDTPESLHNLALQIGIELDNLATKDYPSESLIEYYLGKDRYKELLANLRISKGVKNDKDLLLSRVLYPDENKPFTQYTNELFQARKDTGITELVAQIQELYGRGGEIQNKINQAISEFDIEDVFWITTSTDPSRIREVALKAKQLIS